MDRARRFAPSSLCLLVLAALLTVPTQPARAAGAATTIRVSVSSSGAQGNRGSGSSYPYGNRGSAISADGRYVTFASYASNLVSGDTNGVSDVFVYDRTTGETERVSVNDSSVEANSWSTEPSISANGRYVAFISGATNLSPSGTSGWNVFVHDRTLGTTSLVNVGCLHHALGHSWASTSPSVSANGRYVAFDCSPSRARSWWAVLVRDRTLHTTANIAPRANGDSGAASISADGRYVVFSSRASNLIQDDTDHVGDVFVRDRMTHRTVRVSVGSPGVQSNGDGLYPSISSDGRLVAFESYASNLVAGDTNGSSDIFLRDRTKHTTARVSVGDGSLGIEGNGDSTLPSISADGSEVAFESVATNLVDGDTNGLPDAFIRDLSAHTTALVSVGGSPPVEGDGGSYFPSISDDGSEVAFTSDATNLVDGDTNGFTDVFLRGPLPKAPRRW